MVSIGEGSILSCIMSCLWGLEKFWHYQEKPPQNTNLLFSKFNFYFCYVLKILTVIMCRGYILQIVSQFCHHNPCVCFYWGYGLQNHRLSSWFEITSAEKYRFTCCMSLEKMTQDWLRILDHTTLSCWGTWF